MKRLNLLPNMKMKNKNEKSTIKNFYVYEK